MLNYKMTPGVKLILIVTVAIHIFCLLVANTDSAMAEYKGFKGPASYVYFSIVPHLIYQDFELHRLVTYMFVHSNTEVFHLLFNCLGLFFFGTALEDRWGKREFIKFFLLSGIMAGIFLCIIAPLFEQHYVSFTIGNSGAVYAVLTAYAMIYPESTVYLLVFPVKARTLLIFIMAFNFLTALTPGSADSWPVHLGGALAGYLLLTGLWRPQHLIKKIEELRYNQKLKKSKQKFRIVKRDDDDDKRGPTLH